MKRDDLMLADLGLDEVRGKSRVPALLDISLSISGLLLALFMFGHLIFDLPMALFSYFGIGAAAGVVLFVLTRPISRWSHGRA